MKRLRWVLLGLVIVVALVTIAGVIKFNLLGNDVFLSGSAVTRADLVGDWVEPIPGMESQAQGFTLHEDGSAKSINMATLLYQHWRLNEGKLTLIGESVGNRTSSTFEEQYQIQSLGNGELRLVDADGRVQEFSKP